MTKNKKIASVMDRIVLHLLDFKSYEGEIDGTMDLTQIGIADAVGIKRGNVVQSIRPLITEGYVECHKVHVPGIKIKRTNYYLTCQGYGEAKTIKEKLGKANIEMMDREGTRSRTSIDDFLNNTSLDIRFVDVVREANTSRLFDCRAFIRNQSKPTFSSSSGLAGIPRPAHFFGREMEGKMISEWMKHQTGATLVVQGMPGIGKTSFVAQFLSDAGNLDAVHYFSIRPWCSLRALLMPLSVFFEDNGKRELRAYLEENKSLDISEVEYLILRTLSDIGGVILTYDDYHNSSEEVQTFFKMLHDLIRETKCKLIVIGRTVNPFYDRKEAAVQKTVLEFTLEGLDQESTLALAGEVGVPDKYLEEIFTHTRGHPLFVELLAAGGTPETNMDIEKFIKDEFMNTLGGQELEALKYMSVHRYAVERRALTAHQKVLAGLVRESILKQSEGDFFELHDMIKTAVYRNLSVNELERFHTKAAEHYLESYSTDNLMEALHHLMAAGKPLEACKVILDREEKLLDSDRMAELAHALGILLAKNIEMNKQDKARLLFMHGHALSFLGEWDDAIMCYNRAMVLAAKNKRLAMKSKAGIAEISLMRNNYSIAQSLFEDILEWADRKKDMELKTEASYQLGTTHERLGDIDLALDYFKNALKISFKTYNRNQLAMAYYGMGRIYQRKNEFRKSLESKKRALEIAMKIDNTNTAAKILTGLGATYDSLELRNDEIESHEKAIALARNNGAVRVLGYALSNAGAAYMDIDELDKSMKCLQEAAKIFKTLGEHYMVATAEMNIAINTLLKGDKEKAVFLFNECETTLKEIEDNSLLMDSYFRFGQTCKKAGCPDEALLLLNKALTISKKIGDKDASRQINHEIRSLTG